MSITSLAYIQILRILNGQLTQVIELGIGGISTFILVRSN